MALWKAGGGGFNKELDLRSWHCGRQRGEVQIKSSILDHGTVQGTGKGKFKQKLRI